MRTNSVLVIEPAASWQRLQESKEYFFEDLEAQMKENHRCFLEALMGYERQRFLNAHPYERTDQRVDQANGFYERSLTSRLGMLELRVHRSLSVRRYAHLLVPKAEKRRRKVESLRNRWLEAKQQYPDLGTRGLREKLPAVYAALYRYDSDWLRAHQPPRKIRALSVDWDERDKALCRNLELAACRLPGATPGQLARAAGMKGWISDRLSRLPRARETWLRLKSSHQSRGSDPLFQRISHALIPICPEHGKPVSDSEPTRASHFTTLFDDSAFQMPDLSGFWRLYSQLR
jgi:hypothetical protein